MNINRSLVRVSKELVNFVAVITTAEGCVERNRKWAERDMKFKSTTKDDAVHVGSMEKFKVKSLSFDSKEEYYACRFCEFSQELDKMSKNFGEISIDALPEGLRNVPDALLKPKVEAPAT